MIPPRSAPDERIGVAALAVMAVFMFWVAWTRPAGLNVPPAIAFALAGAIGAAALSLHARIRGRPGQNALYASLVFACFAGTGFWIAFSPRATGGCTARLGPDTAATASASPGIRVSSPACRVAFGSGAVLSTIMAGVALGYVWRERRS